MSGDQEEADLLPISGLQHLEFCGRQCALIHVERLWAENRHTAEGKLLHERVDEGADENRRGLRTLRGVHLRSLALGLSGRADLVELRRLPESRTTTVTGLRLPRVSGAWRVVPVEFKRGKPKANACDRVQLCAQAIALEEMLAVEIESGEIFYGTPRRRTVVEFDPLLRSETANAARRFHELVRSGRTPNAEKSPKCRNCSLLDLCLPGALSGRSVPAYLRSAVRTPQDDSPEGE